MRRLFVGFVVLAIALACSDTSAPVATAVPTSRLHIVAQSASAPPLYADSVSFYAVVGQDREVRMYYQGATPGVRGDEMLRFKVPGDGLLRRPDGTAFQPRLDPDRRESHRSRQVSLRFPAHRTRVQPRSPRRI